MTVRPADNLAPIMICDTSYRNVRASLLRDTIAGIDHALSEMGVPEPARLGMLSDRQRLVDELRTRVVKLRPAHNLPPLLIERDGTFYVRATVIGEDGAPVSLDWPLAPRTLLRRAREYAAAAELVLIQAGANLSLPDDLPGVGDPSQG